MILAAYRAYYDLIKKVYADLDAAKRVLHSGDIRAVQDLIQDVDDQAVQTYVPNLLVEGEFNTWGCRVDCLAFDAEKCVELADPLTQQLRYDTRNPDHANRVLTEYQRHAGYSLYAVRFQFKLRA